MASMREMAKKNLDKMVKGAAREVNTSRPAARDAAQRSRSGASATPSAPAKTAAEVESTPAPARASGSETAAAEAQAAKTSVAATEVTKSSASTGEVANASPIAEAAKTSAPSAEAAKVSASTAEAGKAAPTSEGAKASASTYEAERVSAATLEASKDSVSTAEAGKVSSTSEASKASASLDESRKSSATESARPSTSVEAGKSSANEAGKSFATESGKSSATEAAKTSAAGRGASATAEAAKSSSSPARQGTVPSSVFEQLQAQIEKNGKTIQKVPVDSIRLHENIRESYHEEHLRTLAESMQKDGLIQFPTLCLKTSASGEFTFVCKNGHRRILAAKSLGWKTIECVILPFASTRDELYHTIAANLREDVFYLDLAQAYQQANHLGEADQAIAARVGVNPRTVGWYRRLTSMPPECQALCRQHPDLFHATWAIQLARKGELPSLAVLMKEMQLMLLRYQAQKDNAEQAPLPDRLPRTIDVEQQKEAKSSLKALFSGARGPSEAQQAWQLVEQLCLAGYFKPALLNRLRRQLLAGAQKSPRRPSSSEA